MQGGQKVYAFDSSLPCFSVPKRAADFRSWSFHVRDPTTADGTSMGAKGSLQLIVSNAPIAKDMLVTPAAWVAVPELLLDIGGMDAAPAMLRDLFNDVGWAALKWTPGSGSAGLLAAWFDGVRR